MRIIIHEEHDERGNLLRQDTIDLTNDPNDQVTHPLDPSKKCGKLDCMKILSENIDALKAGGWHLQTSRVDEHKTAFHIVVAACQHESATAEMKALNLTIPKELE